MKARWTDGPPLGPRVSRTSRAHTAFMVQLQDRLSF
jgi:hypothetical protein